MRGNLLMSRRDELDSALAERVQQGNDGVTTQAENHFDADSLQVVRELIGGDPRAGRGFDAVDSGLA